MPSALKSAPRCRNSAIPATVIQGRRSLLPATTLPATAAVTAQSAGTPAAKPGRGACRSPRPGRCEARAAGPGLRQPECSRRRARRADRHHRRPRIRLRAFQDPDDFLRNKEVVLTFDDGPWPANTPAVLAALKAEMRARDLLPGSASIRSGHPGDPARQVAEQGTHHRHPQHARGRTRRPVEALTLDQAKDEIEKGVSAVHAALEGPSAPFIRFPALRHPPEVVAYVGQRNMAIFSTDIDPSISRSTRPIYKVISTVMTKLDKLRQSGIILMHDFQKDTAAALPELLRRLKAGGYKVVHLTRAVIRLGHAAGLRRRDHQGARRSRNDRRRRQADLERGAHDQRRMSASLRAIAAA